MRLSIITINYNNREGLKRTIESVVAQSYHQYEYIIIDGGSTDGSIDIIKKYENYVSYWVSEKDDGIYDAMNKGIHVATGDYCNFLNSGDCYHDKNVLSKLEKFSLSACMGKELIIGNVLNVDEIHGVKKIWTAPDSLSMLDLFEATPNHQASFFPAALVKQRLYDTTYRILGDFDLFMYCLLKENVPYKKMDCIVVDYYLGGFSSTNISLYNKERQYILNHYLPERVIVDYEKITSPKSRFEKQYNYLKKNSRSMMAFAGYILELMALPIRMRNYLKVKL